MGFYGLGDDVAKKIAFALGGGDVDDPIAEREHSKAKRKKISSLDAKPQLQLAKSAGRRTSAVVLCRETDESEATESLAEATEALQADTVLELSEGPKAMVLAGNGIEGGACAAIVRAIGLKARHLTSLDLRENTIGVEGALALAECLVKGGCWLKSLDLSGNKLGEASQRQRQQYKVKAPAAWKPPSMAEVFANAGKKGGKKKKGGKEKSAPAQAKKAPKAKPKPKAKPNEKLVEAAPEMEGDKKQKRKHSKDTEAMVTQSVRHRMALKVDANVQSANDIYQRVPAGADPAVEKARLLRRSRQEVARLPASHVGETPAQILLKALCTNRSLKILRINHNGINSGEELSDMLQQNEHLEHLECAWNEIRGGGALKVAKALASNMGLRNIDLHFNAFGDAAATVLAVELPKYSAPRPKAKPGGKPPSSNKKLSSKLRCINLGGNRITDASCGALAVMMSGASTLHALLLDGNPISKQGAMKLRQSAMEANAVVSLEGCAVLSHAERVGMNEQMERPRLGGAGN
jgi:hypothetical protein